MHNLIRLLSAAILLQASIATAAEKYALLIGVTKYSHAQLNSSPLKYPEADATAVADVLKQSGYTVNLLKGKDATKEAVESALQQLGKEGNAEGVVLIGMFGHGMQYGQDGYFCPVDTTVQDVKDFKGIVQRAKSGQLKQEADPQSMISMRQVLDALQRSPAKNRIILADCCREDPNATRGRNAFGSNLTTADLPDGTAALFACSRNEQAFEHDDWQHGAFTRAFLDQIGPIAAQGNVTAGTLAEKVHASVQAMVSDKTKGKSQQTVTYINTGIVDLQLARSKSSPSESVEMKPSTKSGPATLDRSLAFTWSSSDARGKVPKDWSIEGGFGIGSNKGRTGLMANAGHHSFTIPKLHVGGDFSLEIETQQLGGHQWELKLLGEKNPLSLKLQDNYNDLFVTLGDPETKTRFFPREVDVPSNGGKPRIFRTIVTRSDGVFSVSVNGKLLIPAVRDAEFADAGFDILSLDVDVRKDAIPFSVYKVAIRPITEE